MPIAKQADYEFPRLEPGRKVAARKRGVSREIRDELSELRAVMHKVERKTDQFSVQCMAKLDAALQELGDEVKAM